MNYREITVGKRYRYQAKEGPFYSRHEGHWLLVTRKCGREIKLVEVTFDFGPRTGETRIVHAEELHDFHLVDE